MAKNKNKQKGDKTKSGAPSPLRAESERPAAAPTPSRAETGPAPATAAGPMPLFYKNLKPLHLKDHADLALKQGAGFAFAAEATAVPLVVGEFMAAARDYPIIFSGTENPVPLVMLGLRKGTNLYVDKDGVWQQGAYVPAYVRRYPFYLVEAQEGRRRILFVDEDSDHLSHNGGAPLVADSKPSETAQNVLKFCEAYAEDQRNTREFCEAVVALDLLDKRDLAVSLPGGKKLVLKDILVIDPRKFEALPDKVFLEWRDRKWLFAVYCHFISGANWQRLAIKDGGTMAFR